jgi:hypothetical protein
MVEGLEHFHKLAEVCLNTSSTMFAITFSIIFGLWSVVGKPSSEFKLGFLIMTITYVIEALMCVFALYGGTKQVLPYVSMFAKFSVIFLCIMIAEMVVMLSSLLFM